MSTTKHPDTRSALLDLAEQLIRTRGYGGFSYADLAKSIGIAKASIHYHFPSKEDLVRSALETYQERYQQACAQIVAAHPKASDQLRAYGQLYQAGLQRGVGCLCAALAVEQDVLPEALQKETAAFFQQQLEWLQQVCAEGVEQGLFHRGRSPEGMARSVLSTLEGALMLGRILGQPEAVETAMSGLLDLMLAGSSA